MHCVVKLLVDMRLESSETSLLCITLAFFMMSTSFLKVRVNQV